LCAPISLTPGTITTREFLPEFSGGYDIELRLSSRAALQRLRPDLIDISWELLEAGKPVQVAPGVFLKGDSHDYNSSTPIARRELYRVIGHFDAKRGHAYQLALHVSMDAPELDATRPQIAVVLEPPINAKDYLVGIYVKKELAEYSFLLAVLIAFLCIRPSFWHSSVRRARQLLGKTQADSP